MITIQKGYSEKFKEQHTCYSRKDEVSVHTALWNISNDELLYFKNDIGTYSVGYNETINVFILIDIHKDEIIFSQWNIGQIAWFLLEE